MKLNGNMQAYISFSIVVPIASESGRVN